MERERGLRGEKEIRREDRRRRERLTGERESEGSG